MKAMARFGLFLFLFFPVAVFSATLNVPEDYASIQGAINESSDGDSVLVAPGTYVQNLDFLGKSIHVVSSDGPLVTIIDGNASNCCVRFASQEDENSILEGFTITNGFSASWGGGIYIEDSSPVIRNNIITGNDCSSHGSGVYYFGFWPELPGHPRIENNIISDNQQGGIALFEPASAWIIGNTLENNVGNQKSIQVMHSDNVLISGNTVHGGNRGIFVENSHRVQISDNVVTEHGGDGIKVSYVDSLVVSGNMTSENGMNGIYLRDINQYAEVKNNLVENNNLDGIYLDNLEDVLMMGNSSSGNEENGIWIRSCEIARTANNSFVNNGESGMYAWVSDSLFIANTLAAGNGIHGFRIRNMHFTQAYNLTAVDNNGNGFENRSNDETHITNSIIRGNFGIQINERSDNETIVTYSNIEGGYDGVGNGSSNPMFVDPENGNYRLQTNSNCIDDGNSDVHLEWCATDLDGNPRFMDHPNHADTGPGPAPAIDLGAYEFMPDDCPQIVVSPEELHFAETYILEHDTLSFTIYSMGTADLILYSLNSSDPTVFEIIWAEEADTLLSPGASTQVEVVFTPSEAVHYEEEVLIVSNCVNIIVDLYGDGTDVSTRETEGAIPEEYSLSPAFPNPFNPSTTIRFGLPEASDVHIDLLNILGQNAGTLLNSRVPAGTHLVHVDGSGLAAGSYFIRLQTDQYTHVHRIILLK